MADTSPNLAFKRLHEGQDTAEVNANEDFNLVDALLHAPIVDRDLSVAPTGVNGKVYIVAGTPGGGDPWNGNGGNIASYYDGWVFTTPKEGMLFWIADEKIFVFYDGTAFTSITQRVSPKNAITAFSGGGQGSAVQLVDEFNRITVVAAAGDSVKLPDGGSTLGLVITVANADSTESMDLFPFSGDAIDGLGTNNAYALAAGKIVTMRLITNSLWISMLGA